MDVVYDPFGPTARPGFSQVRLTVIPGDDNGIDRLCVIAGPVSLVRTEALGLFYVVDVSTVSYTFDVQLTVMFNAGKFCHARCVLFSGHEVMYGARSVHAMICVMPGINHS